MSRTTVSIDDPIMRDLKRLQRQEKKPLGRLISELLAEALGRRRAPGRVSEPPLEWISLPMGAARVDLEDKEAVRAMLDREDFPEFFK